MSILLGAIRAHAKRTPDRPALADATHSTSYAELDRGIDGLSRLMRSRHLRTVGLFADNAIAWVLTDLAALSANLTLVPLPLFFSPTQLLHAMADSGIDAIFTDRPQLLRSMLGDRACQDIDLAQTAVHGSLALLRLTPANTAAGPVTADTSKITYTSGTTGNPKGVRLARSAMESVMVALLHATEAVGSDHHLCLTPLSTLLENIGGVHVPLLAGACSHVLPLAEVGLRGASGLDAARMLAALHQVDASSAIMVPQMLHGLLQVIERGAHAPPHLRFVAVGGAPVSIQLLQRAEKLGLPVFEGYGLSECASVVALNTARSRRPGSVGRPLPHLQLEFAPDGEILVRGAQFCGYLGEDAPAAPWPTGDLGYLDADGYLHLCGRKKSMFITAFGRNVAPEWIERELIANPAIVQAAVFGESRPFNVAVIVPAADADDHAVQLAIEAANQILPDYARVHEWLRAAQPFSFANQQLTANGRVRRAAIRDLHSESIEALYQEELNAVL